MIAVDQTQVSTLVYCTSCPFRELIEPRVTRTMTRAAAVAAGVDHQRTVHPDDDAALVNIERAHKRHAANQSA